jgi:RNA polymerase sigma-70 factor (ECF subfamily)
MAGVILAEEEKIAVPTRVIINKTGDFERLFPSCSYLSGGFYWNYALHLTHNPDVADDLMQESILKAFKGFDTFRKGSNAKAWMKRIILNTYINHYNRKKNQYRLGIDIPMYEETTEGPSITSVLEFDEDLWKQGNGYWDSVLSESLSGRLYNKINAIPEVFRECVIMCDIVGLSYAYIANLLNENVGTVKSRIFRGRAILRKDLTKDDLYF